MHGEPIQAVQDGKPHVVVGRIPGVAVEQWSNRGRGSCEDSLPLFRTCLGAVTLKELSHDAKRKVALEIRASCAQHNTMLSRGDGRRGFDQRRFADTCSGL